MKFTKYEAAGNTYLIVNEEGEKLLPQTAIRCCHPIWGIGSDGIISWKSVAGEDNGVQVTIFNPDGSMAEKSGNGLRILATFLFDNVLPTAHSLKLFTLGGCVFATRIDNQTNCNTLYRGSSILLEMGAVTCQINEKSLDNSPNFPNGVQLATEIGKVTGFPVSIGNPHFVSFVDRPTADYAKKWGPLIEHHSRFPNRTNVQFIKVIDTKTIQAEIWERGAGYTLSSGSSSCAIAAVVYQLGMCQSDVTISMPGGLLNVKLQPDGTAWLTGPVNKTVEGVFNLTERNIMSE